MQTQKVLLCIPLYVILCLPYHLTEHEQACSAQDEFVDEYLLEVKDIYVQDVRAILEEGFGLQYVEHIIADLHLFRNRGEKKERVSEEYVQMIKSRTGGRVKYFEQQCLKKLIPPSTVHHRFGHSRRIRRFSLAQEEQCNPLSSLGVYKAWKQGSSGKHVRIIIVDTGVDYTNLDLQKNFDKSLCYDFLSSATECMPDGNYIDQEDTQLTLLRGYIVPSLTQNAYICTTISVLLFASHGTLCSGLIAGEKGNRVCGDGVAYNATIGAARIFNIHGKTQDSFVAKSLSYKRDEVDIYSCSWGFQRGVYDNLGKATQTALVQGARQGRNQKGSVYVFPSGNGGSEAHCNWNGYARNVHTITIGSVGFDGVNTRYTEICPCVLATAFGEGGEDDNSKLKTTEYGRESCTWSFKGSSVSAALATGIIALALEVNNNLTSRDIQHLLVRTSDSSTTLWKAQWRTNGARHKINDYFGFGLINASEMVLTAKTWKQVNELHICRHVASDVQNYNMTIHIKSDGCTKSLNEVLRLEHVEVQICFKTKHRDKLKIVLTSPMGTSSTLMNQKQRKSVRGIMDEEIKWVLMSVQFWDENPVGTWNLTICGDFSGRTHFVEVSSVLLILYGTSDIEYKEEKEVPEGHEVEIPFVWEDTNTGIVFIMCILFVLPLIITCNCLIYKKCLGRHRHEKGKLLAGE